MKIIVHYAVSYMRDDGNLNVQLRVAEATVVDTLSHEQAIGLVKRRIQHLCTPCWEIVFNGFEVQDTWGSAPYGDQPS